MHARIRAIHFTLLLFGFLAVLPASAQLVDEKGDAKKAAEYFNSFDYANALREYILLADANPESVQYNYMVGVCYVKSGSDDTKAIPYLEKVVETGKFDNDAHYYLGKAYHHNLELEKAIKMLQKYSEEGYGKAAIEQEVLKDIEYCENAKEITKFPLNVRFENLGSEVNSIYPDYFPFIPVDESFLVYNTRRDDGSEAEYQGGGYTSNIYISQVENGEFTTGVPLGGHINSPGGSEQVVGLSGDGKTMMMYFDSYGIAGNLLTTQRVGNTWDRPEILPPNINAKKARQLSGCIAFGNSAIIFASDRKGGYGGTDLWISKKLPTGEWGPAQNLGSGINTAADEDFPNISSDGKTLYFSSKGHTSIGGFDIFKAKLNPDSNKFMNPRNMGYPLNTTYDDMNYRASESGRYGYIASKRPEGYGDFDIYRVTFNDIESELTAIRGLVTSTDSTKGMDEIFITVTDNATNDVYGTYIPNSLTNRFIIILPPGEFNIFVEGVGHDPVSQDVTILGKSSFQAEIKKNFVLQSNNY